MIWIQILKADEEKQHKLIFSLLHYLGVENISVLVEKEKDSILVHVPQSKFGVGIAILEEYFSNEAPNFKEV